MSALIIPLPSRAERKAAPVQAAPTLSTVTVGNAPEPVAGPRARALAAASKLDRLLEDLEASRQALLDLADTLCVVQSQFEYVDRLQKD